MCELGIDNIVVDPASIEVNRRARRAKTDRLDADKLLTMLIRHHARERVWSVLHEPSPADDDARRELQRLMHEPIAHTNRIGSLLVLHNLRPGIVIGGRDWPLWLSADRELVATLLRAELERECERLKLVKDQVRAIEAAHRRELADAGALVTGDCQRAWRACSMWCSTSASGSDLPCIAHLLAVVRDRPAVAACVLGTYCLAVRLVVDRRPSQSPHQLQRPEADARTVE